MPEQNQLDQEHTGEELRTLQDQIWSRDVCELALAVRRLWKGIAQALNISEDAIHALTNLAKTSGDHTLSITELAEHSDLSIDQATAAIDNLVKRGLAVSALPRKGESLKDRRVRLPEDFVGMVFEYYRLQPRHRAVLDQFPADQFGFIRQFLAAISSVANDQARAVHARQIDPVARFKDSLDGTG